MMGKVIKDLRIAKGLTQEALAEELHISRSALAMYETDRRDLPNSLILEVAKYFEVSTDYLFGLED